MTKVVINGEHGGFSISIECARRMAELGSAAAAEELREHAAGDYWSGFLGMPETDDYRADPALVQAVEELGEHANGNYAALRVVEVPDDVEWEIANYDGLEWVAEKHRIWK